MRNKVFSELLILKNAFNIVKKLGKYLSVSKNIPNFVLAKYFD